MPRYMPEARKIAVCSGTTQGMALIMLLRKASGMSVLKRSQYARYQAAIAARISWTSAAAERGLNRIMLFAGRMRGPFLVHYCRQRHIDRRPDRKHQFLRKCRRPQQRQRGDAGGRH